MHRHAPPAADAAPDPGPADCLGRAIAYIEAHARERIRLPDIASAAAVTPGALRHAFRTGLDTTPMGYLRRVRLDGARRELRFRQGTTIAAIAKRWGFPDQRRFAAAYQAAHGESPVDTWSATAQRGRAHRGDAGPLTPLIAAARAGADRAARRVEELEEQIRSVRTGSTEPPSDARHTGAARTDSTPDDIGSHLRHAAQAHRAAARTHRAAATLYDRLGDSERAAAERRMAERDEQGAVDDDLRAVAKGRTRPA